jgi:hypothetical protein
MKMIKIRLERWEKALVMQVLEQDEALRGNLDFKASNGWALRSVGSPDFNSNITKTLQIFIRGEQEHRDMNIAVKYFDSNARRDKYHKNIVQLFTEYNNRDQAEPKESEENIFVLR